MKRILFAVLCWSLVCAWGEARTDEVPDLSRKALACYRSGDMAGFRDFTLLLTRLKPRNLNFRYNLACGYALNGQAREAAATLERLLHEGTGWAAETDPDFDSIRQTADFQRVMQTLGTLKVPVCTSTVAFTLPERDLMPEGMAYDPVDQFFYLGSLYRCKIIRVDADGQSRIFVGEKRDGLRQVTGMKVDAQRRHLWVCSEVSSPRMEGYRPDELGWSGLFCYDLASGRLLAKYPLFEAGRKHLFNDLVLTREGDVYCTDSEAKAVYRVRQQARRLELFLQSDRFSYPNDLALTPDERGLYLAGGEDDDLVFIDLENRSWKPLKHPRGVTSAGVDGLYLYGQALVAVQNGLARVVLFRLDASEQGIIGIRVLERFNPHFDIPTTGAVVGDAFCYIANSQMGRYRADGTIFPGEQLEEIVILRCPLPDA